MGTQNEGVGFTRFAELSESARKIVRDACTAAKADVAELAAQLILTTDDRTLVIGEVPKYRRDALPANDATDPAFTQLCIYDAPEWDIRNLLEKETRAVPITEYLEARREIARRIVEATKFETARTIAANERSAQKVADNFRAARDRARLEAARQTPHFQRALERAAATRTDDGGRLARLLLEILSAEPATPSLASLPREIES